MLLCEPDVLIADEPTTALDVTIQAQILELMQSFRSSAGCRRPSCMITHDLGVIAGLARPGDGHVCRAHRRKRAGAKTCSTRPQHPYTRRPARRSMPRLSDQGGHRTAPRSAASRPTCNGCRPGCPFQPRCFRYAFDRCPVEVPLLREIGEGAGVQARATLGSHPFDLAAGGALAP
jgi:ABC-type dipeptide/oligopeptide/nickel transport system ATPase component